MQSFSFCLYSEHYLSVNVGSLKINTLIDFLNAQATRGFCSILEKSLKISLRCRLKTSYHSSSLPPANHLSLKTFPLTQIEISKIHDRYKTQLQPKIKILQTISIFPQPPKPTVTLCSFHIRTPNTLKIPKHKKNKMRSQVSSSEMILHEINCLSRKRKQIMFNIFQTFSSKMVIKKNILVSISHFSSLILMIQTILPQRGQTPIERANRANYMSPLAIIRLPKTRMAANIKRIKQEFSFLAVLRTITD